jgi:hypothetical protein
MTLQAPGDIVSVVKHPGIWIVVGPGINAVPACQHWRVRQKASDGLLIGLTVFEGDLTLLHRPNLGAGRTILHQGVESVIIADLGDRVRLTSPAQSRPLDHEPIVTVHISSCESELGKADVVLENLRQLLKEAT